MQERGRVCERTRRNCRELRRSCSGNVWLDFGCACCVTFVLQGLGSVRCSLSAKDAALAQD